MPEIRVDAMASFARKQKRNRTNENRIQRTQVVAIGSILNGSRDTNFTIIKSLGLKRERIARTDRRFLQWLVVDAFRAKYALFAVCGKNT